jgi:hypothetical protein
VVHDPSPEPQPSTATRCATCSGSIPGRIDLSAKLPRDDTGYGFDNIADVLSTSPLAIEQYLAAAERAIEVSLGPVVEFGDHAAERFARSKGRRPGASRAGDSSCTRTGVATGRFAAPLTGEYLVRVRAWETHGREMSSRAWSCGSARRTSTRCRCAARARPAPQDFEFRVRGSRRVEQTIGGRDFLNDFYEKDVADRNLGVESISVAGPLDEQTTERPAAWARVFAPARRVRTDVERATAVLGAFAGRAYRRPATEAQVRSLLRVYRGAARIRARDSSRPSARRWRQRWSRPTSCSDPSLTRTRPTPRPEYTLDGYELASRLSYFLWSSMPDETLLAAAADGTLLTDVGLAAQVKRMLADRRSDAFVENFAGQWLQLRALDAIAIDRSKFPEYDDALRADMISEATLFFAEVCARIGACWISSTAGTRS